MTPNCNGTLNPDTRWEFTLGCPTAKEDITKLRWLDQFLGGRHLDTIGRAHIDRITDAKRAQGCSNATVNRTLELVRAILRKCVNEWEVGRRMTANRYAVRWRERCPYNGTGVGRRNRIHGSEHSARMPLGPRGGRVCYGRSDRRGEILVDRCFAITYKRPPRASGKTLDTSPARRSQRRQHETGFLSGYANRSRQYTQVHRSLAARMTRRAVLKHAD